MSLARYRSPCPQVLCVGEILWDALPKGLFPGGAPFNVARHLRALGEDATFASRVGADVLGDELLRRLPPCGLERDLLQVDDALPTGLVRVGLDAAGEPDYEIVEPAAWDAIRLTEGLRTAAEQADALVFGSLAQRRSPSRDTLQTLWQADLLRVFDVNLRPPHVNTDVIAASLEAADVVKCNEAELERLGAWYDVPSDGDRTAALADRFGCAVICVTYGAKGAGLWIEGTFSRQPGYEVDVADAVGAGDAFLAALLSALLEGRETASTLALANRLGAYVASRRGAVPAYDVDSLDDIDTLPLNDA